MNRLVDKLLSLWFLFVGLLSCSFMGFIVWAILKVMIHFGIV